MDQIFEKMTHELEEKGEIYIRVKVHPGASHTGFKDILAAEEGETIKLDVAAMPERGKANRELLRFLKKALQADEASIISGGGERLKLIKLKKMPKLAR